MHIHGRRKGKKMKKERPEEIICHRYEPPVLSLDEAADRMRKEDLSLIMYMDREQNIPAVMRRVRRGKKSILVVLGDFRNEERKPYLAYS